MGKFTLLAIPHLHQIGRKSMLDLQRYHYMEQGSDEWFDYKLGKVSASHISDVLATVKNGEAVTRRNYRAKLLCETLTGEREDSFQSFEMQRGTDLEADARRCYEFIKNVNVGQVGFIDHPTIKGFGCSPDGLVDDGIGGTEFKCPKTAIHLYEYMRDGKIPNTYMTQMQGQMACQPELKYIDFVSYDPRLPTHLQMFISRVMRDKVQIKEIETAVKAFIKDLNQDLKDMKTMKTIVAHVPKSLPAPKVKEPKK